ncbi:MAG: domain S-box protein [Sphingobacteriaceae bacterium]|jgi:PAS domain S-box-containing protein|nr:domain S-box protein [Sphingobacteriaceae bacterium]
MTFAASDPLSNPTFLESLPVAIYTCDKDGYITSFNQAAKNLWGREPEIGKDRFVGWWKAFQSDGSPITPETSPMSRALRERVPSSGEEIIIETPAGDKRIVLPYASPLFDAEGKLSGGANTLLDITDQKSGESKQALLAAIIESSDDVIISKTLKGIITSWNRSAEKLFGYKEEEVLGKHISILIPPDRLAEEDLIIGKVSCGQSLDHFETIRVTKTGEPKQISLTVSPVKDKHGKIIGASKIARDITKQKLAEEQLQRYANSLKILNTIGRAISEDLDVQGILQKVTDATTKLTGAQFGAFFYNTVNEQGEALMLYTLSGAPREAFEKFGMPRNTAVFHATFSGQGIVRVDDITKDERYGKSAPHYGMPKGHLPVVSYLAVPVFSKDGTVIGGLFFGHQDAGIFTEEHEHLVNGVAAQAAVALDNAKLYEEIKVLNSKKDEFIGMASHELKTPVTSINGYLQILERSVPDEDRNKSYIVKARQQVGKLSTLISDLLDVSKIQTGKLPFNYVQFDLVTTLKEVVDVMRQSNSSHTINLNLDPDELIIVADQQRIEQVVINLISNAVKYAPGSEVVNVYAGIKGRTAKVSVQDFGIGIEKDQQDRIFSRFYRVESLASHMSGLGIGLYISHEIIARHNGKLWVASKPGEGSTFTFEIPVEQPSNI